MAALARWCVRHRLVAVLLWLLALGGTAAAAVTLDRDSVGSREIRDGARSLLEDGPSVLVNVGLHWGATLTVGLQGQPGAAHRSAQRLCCTAW